MRNAKWSLFAVLALASPTLVGCMGGHIITASTVAYVQFHGTMPWAKTKPVRAKKKPIPAHLSETVGLGDTKAFIDAAWGKPSKITLPLSNSGNGSAYYQKGTVFVQFENGRAADLTWKPPGTVSIFVAEKTAKTMLPKDAVFAQTVTLPNQSELYQQWTSSSIKAVFTSSLAVSEYVTVVYDLRGSDVTSFEIKLGQTL